MMAVTRHISNNPVCGTGLPRLFVLYVLARGAFRSMALVIGVASLYGVLNGWASTSADGGLGETEVLKQFGLMQALPAAIASVIGMSAWSPFGEVERTAGSSLPRLRLLHIGLLLVLGIGVSWALLLGWTSRLPGIDPGLVALRNLLGMTGSALLVGRYLDARVSWLLPLAMAMVAVFRSMSVAIERIWSPPAWFWNGQSPSANESWAIAMTIFVAGGALFLRDGAKDASGEEE